MISFPSAVIGATRTNWRTADPAVLALLKRALQEDSTEPEFLAMLNTLTPDESAQVPLDREHGVARHLRLFAGTVADGELQPLGGVGVIPARPERDPLPGRVDHAEAGGVDPEQLGARPGQPDRQQLGAFEAGLVGDRQRGLEPSGDAHTS